MTNSVEVKKLSFNYGKVEILKNLDLNIEDGEFMVLLGPSGCGKTTLLNCIAGLLDIDDGQIWIESDNVTWKEPKDRHIGMVFQSYALYPSMTVEKNLSFGLRMMNEKKDIIKDKIKKASELLQIGDLLHRKPSQLSGGQRQRVAIGRALVRDAKVFLFDEPLSNLDAKLRAELRYEIKKLHRDLGNTMIYVTHDQIEAMTMADKIVVMKDGYIEQTGSPLEVYDKPANTFVASFIGSPAMNMIEGTVEIKNNSYKLQVAGTKINLPNVKELENGQKIIIGIRPEYLFPSNNGIPAKIAVVEPTGSETHLLLRANDQDLTCVIRERENYSPGQDVKLTTDQSSIHIFNYENKLRIY